MSNLLTETLFVRADRVCVGDRVVMAAEGWLPERQVFVTQVSLVGDDVNLTTFRDVEFLNTSQGNVLKVEREVLPTNGDRYFA